MLNRRPHLCGVCVALAVGRRTSLVRRASLMHHASSYNLSFLLHRTSLVHIVHPCITQIMQRVSSSCTVHASCIMHDDHHHPSSCIVHRSPLMLHAFCVSSPWSMHPSWQGGAPRVCCAPRRCRCPPPGTARAAPPGCRTRAAAAGSRRAAPVPPLRWGTSRRRCRCRCPRLGRRSRAHRRRARWWSGASRARGSAALRAANPPPPPPRVSAQLVSRHMRLWRVGEVECQKKCDLFTPSACPSAPPGRKVVLSPPPVLVRFVPCVCRCSRCR
jgi:hypothetical protein